MWTGASGFVFGFAAAGVAAMAIASSAAQIARGATARRVTKGITSSLVFSVPPAGCPPQPGSPCRAAERNPSGPREPSGGRCEKVVEQRPGVVPGTRAGEHAEVAPRGGLEADLGRVDGDGPEVVHGGDRREHVRAP